MVGAPAGKDLRLVLQPPESPRVHHAVAVTLEIITVSVALFSVAPSPALFRAQRIRGKHGQSVSQGGDTHPLTQHSSKSNFPFTARRNRPVIDRWGRDGPIFLLSGGINVA